MTYKILIIEDNKDQEEELKLFLSTGPYGDEYEIDTAVNRTLALKKSAHRPPDLIILDLRLVERGDPTDGFAIIKELRDGLTTRNVGIIVWTANHVEPDDEIRALRAGADDYVIKGNPVSVLEARINALLRRIKR